MKTKNKKNKGERKLFIKIRNFFFCLKYPFWKSKNVWTGKSMGYAYTWYDAIPNGWRIAFGEQLSKDIKTAFKIDKKRNPKLKWKDAIFWSQIKEKWGGLRLYASATETIQKVLDYYERVSELYCIDCGAPALYMTTGYILPFCEKCFDGLDCYDHLKKNKKEYQSFKKECKIKGENKKRFKPAPVVVESFFANKKEK